MPRVPSDDMADDKKQKTLFLDDGMAPPPAASPPLSNQKTMMLDASAPAAAPREAVVPTMMKQPPRDPLPPVRAPRPPSAWGRWVAGPLIAAAVAAATVFVAGRVMPRPARGAAPPAKPQGRLRVSTEPPGASILVDGKRFPRFTPATIEGDVGATIKLTFSMDGFETRDAEVYMAAGEHNFSVRLKPVAAPAPSPPVAAPAPPPRREHHAPRAKEPAGKAAISIFVRPWAIVFVDHQRLRQTPVQSYALPSGKHTIELVNEGKNRREKIEVNLKPGEEQEIRRDWDK